MPRVTSSTTACMQDLDYEWWLANYRLQLEISKYNSIVANNKL